MSDEKRRTKLVLVILAGPFPVLATTVGMPQGLQSQPSVQTLFLRESQSRGEAGETAFTSTRSGEEIQLDAGETFPTVSKED